MGLIPATPPTVVWPSFWPYRQTQNGGRRHGGHTRTYGISYEAAGRCWARNEADPAFLGGGLQADQDRSNAYTAGLSLVRIAFTVVNGLPLAWYRRELTDLSRYHTRVPSLLHCTLHEWHTPFLAFCVTFQVVWPHDPYWSRPHLSGINHVALRCCCTATRKRPTLTGQEVSHHDLKSCSKQSPLLDRRSL